MNVIPPKLHDLSQSPLSSKIPKDKEIWEVSTPPDRSLYWSLVLSFVITSHEKSEWFMRLLGSETEMKELMMKKKIPVEKLDSKSIKSQATNFNPFKNQHSFYHNQELIKVVRMFSLRLKRAANKRKRISGESDDEKKLQAATKMLKCCIELYETDSEGINLPPKFYAPVVHRDILFLFKHSEVCKKFTTKSQSDQKDDHKVITIFSFGMGLNHVIPLRRDALGHILKRTNLSREIIVELQREFIERNHFLISLLEKNSRMETVPSIYASPYIAWKLAAAGFITDPCSLDSNGLSAFYHCMGQDSTFLLRVLYDYASNSFEPSDKTTRNPNADILKALIKIGQTLRNDYSKSNAFSKMEDKRKIALKRYEEILSFNEYQCSVVKEINELSEQSATTTNSNDNKSAEDSNNRVNRKHIITSLLKCYVNQMENIVMHGDKYKKFQNFIQCSEYYENIDNYTCLLFFDNFLFLDLPFDIMKSVVENLFLTMFGYKQFPKCIHGVDSTASVLTTESCALHVIPFIFRSNFLESAKDILQELTRPSLEASSKSPKHQSKEENDPNSVMRHVFSCLKYLPEIKDEFIICRLKKYLDIAVDVPLSEDNKKGVLTIERALQVIGETLNTTDSNSVIGHLLCSCLPKDLVVEFFRIRNHCLSHYRPRLMGGKLSLEKQILTFKSIQNVISEVLSMVYPVHISQFLRIADYMFKVGLDKSKDIHENIAQNMETEYKSITNFQKEKYISNQGKYKCLTNNLLNYIEEEAEDEKCNKFQKNGQISALKFLFIFLADQCDDANKNRIIHILPDLDSLNKVFENKANATKQKEIEISLSEQQEIIKIVSDLREITDCIFPEVKEEAGKSINPSIVKTFLSDCRSFSWFSNEEMLVIKEKISESLQLSRKARESLVNVLKNENELSELELQELRKVIFATEKDKNRLSENFYIDSQITLDILSSIKKDEQDVFNIKNDLQDDLDCLIKFSETTEGINLLLKMDFSSDLYSKILQFLNRKIEFLLDRISHLKSILIDEDEEILSLWKWGKSEAIKIHSRFLMGQRYMREKDVRASLEMLLFDCMNILNKRKSLNRLWLKANNLFSGANLRNILSHGNTILEIVGGCLDENDLSSHLIDKMLELIEDGDALKILSSLWEKAKITDLKQFEIMLNADDPSLLEIQKWMKKRPENIGGWKDYLPLLPLK